MGFRFRKRTRIGPFAFNWSAKGLSSISLGGPGASINIPVARDGGVRRTVGLPGTGLSWTEQDPAPTKDSVAERRHRQRQVERIPTTEQTIRMLMRGIIGPECVGDALWRQGLVDRVLAYEDTPRNVREAAVLIRNPEACELHCRRARGPAATNRAALEVTRAIQTVLAFTEAQGWSTPA